MLRLFVLSLKGTLCAFLLCSTLFAQWTQKRSIQITNSTGSPLTDHQVLITLNTSDLGSPYAQINADGSDIRFSADADPGVNIPYYIESWNNTGNSLVWVKVPSIPAGTTTPISLYYGNALATDASNSGNTFEFFDHFDDGTLAPEWTVSNIGSGIGSASESGSTLRIDATQSWYLVYSNDDFVYLHLSGSYDNVLIESLTTNSGGYSASLAMFGGVQMRQSTARNSRFTFCAPQHQINKVVNRYRLDDGTSTSYSGSNTTAFYCRISRTGNSSRSWFSVDGNVWNELGSERTFTTPLSNPVLFGPFLGASSNSPHFVELDWFRIRKYASTEPTSSIQSETTGDYTLPVSLSAFNAHSVRNGISVSWVTESEIDNVGFILKRKERDEPQFTTISSYIYNHALKGQLNSNISHSYTYLDKDVSEKKVYSYQLTDVDISGKQTTHEPIEIEFTSPSQPQTFRLLGNYPNPFNPITKINFSVPASQSGERVKITVFDSSGKSVKTLLNSPMESGTHSVLWNGETHAGQTVTSGIYYAVLYAGKDRLTHKMIMLK